MSTYDKLAKLYSLSEEEKEELHLSSAEHLSHTRTEREPYRSQCRQAIQDWKRIVRTILDQIHLTKV